MARTFNRAYDQADRILNGSGLSSIVYRQGGGRSDDPDLEDASFFKKAKQYILDSKLPYDTKMELYNLVAGEPTKYGDTGQPRPNTKLQRGASNFLKDMVVSITAPVGTPVGKGASMIPGLQTTTDLTRRGLQSLLQNKTIREKLAEFADSHRKPGSKKPIPPNIQLFIDQFSPDKVIDGKRYYTPITDENKSKYFDEASQGRIGKNLKTNLKKELGLYNTGFRKSGKLGAADIRGHEEGWALGRVNYGSYDSRGNWQPGIPDWDGNFTIKDEYDWNRTHRMGPGGIAREFMELFDGGVSPVQFAEAVGGTVGAQEGEGRKIEFKVPGFSDPVKQLEVMNRLDRPLINPKGLAHLPDPNFGPLARTEREDKIYSKGVGLPGIGWHHEAFDDPDDFTEQYADYHIGLKHGGQTMSRGLSGINKTININGQPHSLAWINPGEASALRAMGGSGKKGPMGIPSYQTDEDWTYDEDTFGGGWTEPSAGEVADFSDYMDYGGADIMGGTIALDKSTGDKHTGELADRDTEWKNRVAYLGAGVPLAEESLLGKGDRSAWVPVTGGFGPRDDPGGLGEFAYGQAPGHWRLQSSLDKFFGIEGPEKKEGFYRVKEKDDLAKYGKEGYDQSRNANNFQNILNSLLNQTLENRARDNKKELSEEDLAKIVHQAAEKAEEAVSGATNFSKGKKLKGFYEGLGGKGVVNKLIKTVAPGGLATQIIAGGANALADFFGVVGTVEINGKGYHVKKDGTISIISPEDDPGYKPSQHHEPGGAEPEQEQKSTPAPAVAAAPPVEKKLTGIAELVAKIKDKKHLLPQFKNIVAAGFSEQEAADMLGVPLADMLDASSDTFIT